MNAIRKILMPLLVIPFGMFIYMFIHPDWQWESPGLESLFAVIGIPILIINFIAWFYPEMIKAYLPLKDGWENGRSKPVTLAIVISALIAFTCVSAGMMSSMSAVPSRPAYRLRAATPMFTASNQIYSDHPDSGEGDIAIPRLLPATDIPPEQALQSPTTETTPEPTPQIPISGGASISSPTRSPTFSATQTKIASASIQSTQSTSTPNLSTGPTSTSNPSGSCIAATSDYQDVVSQSVQDWDSGNTVGKVWMVQSKAASNLWFLSAKISGPQLDTNAPPGVWGVYVDSQGNFDLYSVNDTAEEFSGAGWGGDNDPPLTMQSEGAQAVYDCAVHAK